MTVVRDNEQKTMPVILRNREGTTKVARNESVNLLGASLEVAEETELGKLGLSHGVKVKELQTGKLKSAGLREGFIITSIDNREVKSTDEYSNTCKVRKAEVPLIEGIYPNGMQAYYGFGM